MSSAAGLFLYKIEVELESEQLVLIVIAENDEKAFDYLEGHVVRHFVHNPSVKQAAIVEKKRLERGAGYVLPVRS